MNAIKIDDLTKYYGKTRGIEHVDLSVRQGDFFGFIGPNGAGKSTTIRTLLGLIRPDSGRAQIFGLNITKERKRILEKVGYLPSEVSFYPGMRVRDVLKLSANLRKRDCAEMADRLCERLQLDTTRKTDELSFGNRKKTAIVCALQHEPDLLIFDEPTSGLDPLMQREFFEILRELNEKGATIFLSSHILSEIQHHCDHAAIIREGRIITAGRVEELSKSGAKRVSIRGSMDCSALIGVRDLRTTPQSIDFLYSGDMKMLLSAMAEGDVQDVSITEPDLEEVFLHYYEKGTMKNDYHES